MGRKPKPVDGALVEKLAAIACTQDEIAVVCGCSVDTLQRRFSGEYKRGRADAKCSLRRKQWQRAVKDGHPGMLIWLGKQLLGQRDKQEVENIGGPNVLNVVEKIVTSRAEAKALRPTNGATS